jgi:rRNA maturation RNase YbeY
MINGEVYISLETVKMNAKNYKVSYISEIIRVIVHGTLHLCGYEDGTKEEKNEMRRLEDLWMERLKQM